jgi:hypothetical protein
MRTLLLITPADHASRTFVAQKTARPDQVPLLVDNHHLAAMETPHQQASSCYQKNTEQNAHYLLTILTGREREARARRADKRAPPIAGVSHHLFQLPNIAQEQRNDIQYHHHHTGQ